MLFTWIPVLIETLWNVKKPSSSPYVLCTKKVLIETLWNVKHFYGSVSCFCLLCINRNIVECKARNIVRFTTGMISINRNIVECKVVNSYMPCATIICINRNIVECKDERGYAES